jgi:translocation and assembly module TamA
LRRSGLLLIAGLAAGLGAELGAQAVAAPPRRPALQPRATVEGVGDRSLRRALEQAAGEAQGPPANRIEARRRAIAAADGVTAYLRSEGYYDADVSPDIGQGAQPQAVVKVTLGPVTRLVRARVRWVGAAPSAEAEAAALKAVDLKPGDPGRAAEVIAGEGRAVAALEQAGYADARADPREVIVDHADHTMHPLFRVRAGALVRLDGVRLSGSTRTEKSWIRRLAPWKTRDVYKPADVAELERRLLDTGVYNSVTVALAPQPDADGLRPVVVSLTDRPKSALALGLGYSTTEGVLADTTYSIFNVLHQADTLSVFAKAQVIDSRLGFTESLPHFLSPGQTLRVGPDIFDDVTNAYTTKGGEVTADLTQRYGASSFLTKGLTFRYDRIDDHELGPLDIYSIRPLVAASLDRTDNVLDATHGYKLDGRAEPIYVFGQENLFYLKLQVQGSTYLPLDARADRVLALRAQAGSIIGGEIPQVPASDRFFAGGGGTVRGYEYQNVGPHYPDNTPQGGLSLIDGSIELRQRLSGPLGAVVFVDSGTVGGNSTPSFSHIASAVGVGLRYDLGFAPVRIDLATPLNRLSGASQPPVQVYLSVGQSF